MNEPSDLYPPTLDMDACPKYEAGSAPICPLDTDWRKRTHLEGERVCLHLTECVKEGASAWSEAEIDERIESKLAARKVAS